jgi:tetratricopeptide (TPR) repeat protein
MLAASLRPLPVSAESNTALMKEAVADYRAGHFADAAGNFYGTLTKEFNNPLVHYYMASCYVHLEDSESAVREFRIAYALAPNTDIGYYSKTALKYFVFNADGTVVGAVKKEKTDSTKSGLSSGAPPAAGVAGGSVGAGAGAGGNGVAAGTTATGLPGSAADVIQSQTKREKESRLTQSAKLADEINKQGNDTLSKAVSGLSSDPREREQQMLRLPDDLKSLLSNLRSEYDAKKKRQLEAGKLQADKLDESAANLQNLIDQHQSLQADSNLYVRRYKQDADKEKGTKRTTGSATPH